MGGLYRKSDLGEKGTFGATSARKQVDFAGSRPLPVNTLLKGPSPVKKRPRVQKGATPYSRLEVGGKTGERDGGRETGAHPHKGKVWGCCRGS